jgi:hypothetical protein
VEEVLLPSKVVNLITLTGTKIAEIIMNGEETRRLRYPLERMIEIEESEMSYQKLATKLPKNDPKEAHQGVSTEETRSKLSVLKREKEDQAKVRAARDLETDLVMTAKSESNQGVAAEIEKINTINKDLLAKETIDPEIKIEPLLRNKRKIEALSKIERTKTQQELMTDKIDIIGMISTKWRARRVPHCRNHNNSNKKESLNLNTDR